MEHYVVALNPEMKMGGPEHMDQQKNLVMCFLLGTTILRTNVI